MDTTTMNVTTRILGEARPIALTPNDVIDMFRRKTENATDLALSGDIINDKKISAYDLGKFCYRNFKTITGLPQGMRDEEGHFPDPIDSLAIMIDSNPHLFDGSSYPEFQDGWNDQ